MALLGRFVAVTDLVQKGNQQKSQNMNMSGLEYESVEGKATNSLRIVTVKILRF